MMTKPLWQLTALAVVGLLVGASLCLLDGHGHGDGTPDLCLLVFIILVAEGLRVALGPYLFPLPSLRAAGIGLVPGRCSPGPI